MTPDRGMSSDKPEDALRVLDRIAADLDALCALVLVSEGGQLDIVYPSAAPLECDRADRAALAGSSVCLESNTGLARLLKAAAAPGVESFLLFTCERPTRAITIAFGYAEPNPPRKAIPPELAELLKLAVFAICAYRETLRLRAELSVINRRFGQRKSVERAKGLLQAEKGITEQEAYECLRKMSRQRRITLADAAETLLRNTRPA